MQNEEEIINLSLLKLPTKNKIKFTCYVFRHNNNYLLFGDKKGLIFKGDVSIKHIANYQGEKHLFKDVVVSGKWRNKRDDLRFRIACWMTNGEMTYHKREGKWMESLYQLCLIEVNDSQSLVLLSSRLDASIGEIQYYTGDVVDRMLQYYNDKNTIINLDIEPCGGEIAYEYERVNGRRVKKMLNMERVDSRIDLCFHACQITKHLCTMISITSQEKTILAGEQALPVDSFTYHFHCAKPNFVYTHALMFGGQGKYSDVNSIAARSIWLWIYSNEYRNHDLNIKKVLRKRMNFQSPPECIYDLMKTLPVMDFNRFKNFKSVMSENIMYCEQIKKVFLKTHHGTTIVDIDRDIINLVSVATSLVEDRDFEEPSINVNDKIDLMLVKFMYDELCIIYTVFGPFRDVSLKFSSVDASFIDHIIHDYQIGDFSDTGECLNDYYVWDKIVTLRLLLKQNYGEKQAIKNKVCTLMLDFYDDLMASLIFSGIKIPLEPKFRRVRVGRFPHDGEVFFIDDGVSERSYTARMLMNTRLTRKVQEWKITNMLTKINDVTITCYNDDLIILDKATDQIPNIRHFGFIHGRMLTMDEWEVFMLHHGVKAWDSKKLTRDNLNIMHYLYRISSD